LRGRESAKEKIFMLLSYGDEVAIDGVKTAIATARTIGGLAARPMSCG
jgi:hypothetical protein